jgi:dTMP kinase
MHIIFEGPDGSGKSTICEKLNNWLTSNNDFQPHSKVKVIRQPGSTTAGEAIRTILKGPIKMHPMARQALHLADTAELNANIPTMLKEYDYILQDRTSFISSPIYSEAEYGHCNYHIDWYKHITIHKADMLFIILSNKSKERADNRTEADHFDAMGQTFHKKVYENYLKFADGRSKTYTDLICNHVTVIYNDGQIDETLTKVIERIKTHKSLKRLHTMT